mmetsp:Transcript_60091/g.161144  ORF Transcript_60091/g.161144 Transcript_60091/m.161144 type:complete len:525 (-) Transcript_60091:115-1689(-)
MSGRKLLIEYSRSNRATCSDPQCLQPHGSKKIDKREIRIGSSWEISPENVSTSWYHLKCRLFSVQRRQRAGTTKIQAPEDLDGFQSLEQPDQVMVARMIDLAISDAATLDQLVTTPDQGRRRAADLMDDLTPEEAALFQRQRQERAKPRKHRLTGAERRDRRGARMGVGKVFWSGDAIPGAPMPAFPIFKPDNKGRLTHRVWPLTSPPETCDRLRPFRIMYADCDWDADRGRCCAPRDRRQQKTCSHQEKIGKGDLILAEDTVVGDDNYRAWYHVACWFELVQRRAAEMRSLRKKGFLRSSSQLKGFQAIREADQQYVQEMIDKHRDVYERRMQDIKKEFERAHRDGEDHVDPRTGAKAWIDPKQEGLGFWEKMPLPAREGQVMKRRIGLHYGKTTVKDWEAAQLAAAEEALAKQAQKKAKKARIDQHPGLDGGVSDAGAKIVSGHGSAPAEANEVAGEKCTPESAEPEPPTLNVEEVFGDDVSFAHAKLQDELDRELFGCDDAHSVASPSFGLDQVEHTLLDE